MTVLIRIIFVTFFMFTWITPSRAQETKRPKDYIIEGKVTIEGGKPATGGAILVGKPGISGGSRASIETDGTYQIKLDYDKEYTITYTKKGYVSQIYQINTKVDKERIEETFINKEVMVELFQFVEGVNIDIMKQPVAKIFYDELLYDFDEDEAYSASMKPQVEELKAKLLAQIELNKNSTLTAEELAKQKAQPVISPVAVTPSLPEKDRSRFTPSTTQTRNDLTKISGIGPAIHVVGARTQVKVVAVAGTCRSVITCIQTYKHSSPVGRHQRHEAVPPLLGNVRVERHEKGGRAHPAARASDLVDDVARQLLDAQQTQDVLRVRRAVDDQFATVHHLTLVHQDVLLLGHQFLEHLAVRVGDLQTDLALGFLAEGHGTGLFGQHADILGRTGFEQLGHTRQTAGDVARLLAFDRNARQHLAGGEILAVAHLDQRADLEADRHRVVGAGDLHLVTAGVEQLDLRTHHLGRAAALRIDHHQGRQTRHLVDLLGYSLL